MNKSILKSLCTILIIITLIPTAFADEIKLDAKNAILVDMQNSMVLYDKNSTEIIQPAGFTKIVTAMVVLENCDDLSQVIAAPKDTISKCDFSFGNMGILAEEELSAKALLEGMLVYDAAEAAEVLAGFTFGNYEKFIVAMNNLAKEAGAQNTVFKNAGGYYHKDQQTTVADISKIALYAMKNDAFAEIVKKGMVEIKPTNKYRDVRYLANTNMFVGRTRSLDFYSERVFGVKTSYMKDHGYGICIAFENSKGKFLCVTAQGAGAAAAHTDAQTMREYVVSGFVNVKIADKDDIIEEVEVPNGKTSHVLLKTADELSVRLPVDYDESKIFQMTTKDNNLSAPIEKDEVLGTLSVSYDGKEVGSVALIAYDSVAHSAGKSVQIFFENIFTSPFFYLPVTVLVIYFAIMAYKANRNKIRRKK
ncbi:MAG: D-alanyl-D-alanine carboxypeptidase [Clostridia bacterium]|nr:D-alanyl-D-alanine carboxypeptidase [Clostridia bacterium]